MMMVQQQNCKDIPTTVVLEAWMSLKVTFLGAHLGWSSTREYNKYRTFFSTPNHSPVADLSPPQVKKLLTINAMRYR